MSDASELLATILIAQKIMAGETIKGSETAITGNLAKAVVYLWEEVERLKRPKPITFAVEKRAGLEP